MRNFVNSPLRKENNLLELVRTETDEVLACYRNLFRPGLAPLSRIVYAAHKGRLSLLCGESATSMLRTELRRCAAHPVAPALHLKLKLDEGFSCGFGEVRPLPTFARAGSRQYAKQRVDHGIEHGRLARASGSGDNE